MKRYVRREPGCSLLSFHIAPSCRGPGTSPFLFLLAGVLRLIEVNVIPAVSWHRLFLQTKLGNVRACTSFSDLVCKYMSFMGIVFKGYTRGKLCIVRLHIHILVSFIKQ